MLADEAFDESRQYVLECGTTGGYFEPALFDLIALSLEGFIDSRETFDDGLGQIEEEFTFVRKLDFGAVTVEERSTELALKRLDLERYGGLAQEHAIGRLGYATLLGGIAEPAELLQAIVLVTDVFFGHIDASRRCYSTPLAGTTIIEANYLIIVNNKH